MLKPYHEIVGILTGMLEREEYVEIVFSMQKKFQIPVDAISTEKLKDLIGKRAGIFNYDGVYRIRKVGDK